MDTRIIWTLWHVPLVSVLTGFHCSAQYNKNMTFVQSSMSQDGLGLACAMMYPAPGRLHPLRGCWDRGGEDTPYCEFGSKMDQVQCQHDLRTSKCTIYTAEHFL